ncbi:uncharacterized protein LOC143527582 [Brachyhypopomus gauderio]|uniref:uncharacterized protein LOC143527582 n=1 Tax=Brachyhypopomus gauderio TaxID=698409 RepID=UPI0040430781
MAKVWILILCLFKLNAAQDMDVYQKPSFIVAKPGENVTFNCTFAEKHSAEALVWYKQTREQTLQNIAVHRALMDAIISPEFSQSKLKLERTKTSITLSVLHATKDDEGLYFCGVVVMKTTEFSTGTFLAVTGDPKSAISVVQSPDVERVPPGESVSLQCSVLSERRTAELQVFWFRSSAGDSHPEIISTHHNSSRQCEISSSPHSCVYNLSKSVLSVSDTGTYYCAVLTCGKILLGNGTTVCLRTPVDAVLMIVGAALGVCVLVISAQAVLICRRRNCEHCSVRLQQETLIKTSTTEERDALELDYAGIQFNERNTRRGQEKRGETEHSVYSEVLNSAVSNQ